MQRMKLRTFHYATSMPHTPNGLQLPPGAKQGTGFRYFRGAERPHIHHTYVQ